jgi:hypothetical protein
LFRSPGFIAGATWLAVYTALLASGERFSVSYLFDTWQLVPWETLSTDPIRSVFYLHTQPPLWNLVLGVLGWMSPASDSLTIQMLMLILGAAAASIAALLAQRLGLGRRFATLAALLATLHPEVLRLAFFPNYELAVAVLLLGLLLASTYIGDVNATHRALMVVTCLATAIVLTRSLYHPVWLGLCLLLVWLGARRLISGRQASIAAAVPIVLIGGWVVKNELLFGTSISSWTGMNLQRSTIPIMSRQELDDMQRDGTVSAIADVRAFSPYEVYEPLMAPCEPRHRHVAVARAEAASGTSNFNYECFLPVYEQAGRDAVTVIRSRPGLFVRGRMWSLRQTYAVDNAPQRSDSIVMRTLDSVFSVGRIDVHLDTATDDWGDRDFAAVISPSRFGLLPIALYIGAFTLGARRLWQAARSRTLTGRSLCFALGALAVGWTIAVGAIGELGEQARFRTMVDPIAWVLSLSAFVPWIAALISRRQGRGGLT